MPAYAGRSVLLLLLLNALYKTVQKLSATARYWASFKEDGKITGVETNKGTIAAKYVVNAAGVYADEIAKLAGDDTFTITPRKGEYILFDKTACSSLVYGVVFPTPTKKSKGILVCTTTHGNTFIGPNAKAGFQRR